MPEIAFIDGQPREVWVDERGTNCGVQDHIGNDGVYDELDVWRGSAAAFGAHAPPKLKRNLLLKNLVCKITIF